VGPIANLQRLEAIASSPLISLFEETMAGMFLFLFLFLNLLFDVFLFRVRA
jgi:hypothetical protein